MQRAADTLGRVLGGHESVRRRLERAGLERTVHDFRVEQLLWGLTAFAAAAAYGLLRALGDPGTAVSSALICFSSWSGTTGRVSMPAARCNTRSV